MNDAFWRFRGVLGDRDPRKFYGCALVLALFPLLTTISSPTRASADRCTVPGYISEAEEATSEVTHYHPTVAIVIFIRDNPGEPSRGRVTKILIPPANLGIQTLHSPQPDDWLYRRIHSHDESGVLHVEPRGGETLRLCQLFEMWVSAEGGSRFFSDLEPHKLLNVIEGDTPMREMKLRDLLMTPLHNNHTILIFVEKGQMA